MGFRLLDNDGALANSDSALFDIKPGCFEERPFFVDSIFTPQECAAITRQLDLHDLAPSRMMGEDDDGYVNLAARSSRRLAVGQALKESVFARIDAAVDKARAVFDIDAGAALNRAEEDLLLYGPGAGFGAHADNSRLARGPGPGAWQLALPHRKLSAVLWLSSGGEDFAGGEFRFLNIGTERDQQGICLRPRAGVLLVFPSHPWYRHQVLPITAGQRISFVGWYSCDRGAG